ncbi:hypothetical protein ACFFQF_32570 [Haladaptatus pallidirubidus]|uniref:TRAM domain-containing protein n=1 Tax=Haladaptatus pallidirubidus TaxID=1008152 RepID=A0AAV3UQM5_9EURY|nr:hypothetical protein [Haladaptatus pallidirubidus]
MTTEDTIEGKVVKIISSKEIVINKGEDDGIEEDMEFIVFEIGDVIEDPDTGEALGNVEHVKARVKPKHIQNEITIMRSAEITTKKTGIYGITNAGETKKVTKSIADRPEDEVDDKVKEGDLVRQKL